jgi:hypothetical protein
MRHRREDLLQTFFTVELAFIDLSRILCDMKIMEFSRLEDRDGPMTSDFAY